MEEIYLLLALRGWTAYRVDVEESVGYFLYNKFRLIVVNRSNILYVEVVTNDTLYSPYLKEIPIKEVPNFIIDVAESLG